jgi:mitochondrial fission protein ELM1
VAPTAEICVISDGKAGHRSQSLGLAEALQRLRPAAAVREVPAARGRRGLLRDLFPVSRDPAAPTLVIGAGHGTHADLVHWRRRGSRAIVLMRPSLPLRFFDLCIEPRHDGGRESDRRWLSIGPLNRIRPAAIRSDGGIILIGGPSPHFTWDGPALIGQLAAVCDGTRSWTLSTSRRTPADFLPALRELQLPALQAHGADELPVDWLARTLPSAAACWISPDSASMVYEALSAGCAVGLFDLVAASGSRVARGVEELLDDGWCTPFAAFARGRALAVAEAPLAEADRIAARIVERGWL